MLRSFENKITGIHGYFAMMKRREAHAHPFFGQPYVLQSSIEMCRASSTEGVAVRSFLRIFSSIPSRLLICRVMDMWYCHTESTLHTISKELVSTVTGRITL